MGYATRRNTFVPSMILRLEGDRLVVEQESRNPERITLQELRAVDLSYIPTRADLNRYRCRLYTQYLPYAVQWVRRNVPKRYPPNQIPAEVLPP